MISSQLFNSHSQRQYLYAGYTAIQSHTAIRNTPLITRDHSFLQQIFFTFRGPVCHILRFTVANFPHIVINLLQPPKPDQICSNCRW